MKKFKDFITERAAKKAIEENEKKLLNYGKEDRIKEIKRLQTLISIEKRSHPNPIRKDFLKSVERDLKEKGFLSEKQIAAVLGRPKRRSKSDKWDFIDQEIEQYDSYSDWENSLSFEDFAFINEIPNQ